MKKHDLIKIETINNIIENLISCETAPILKQKIVGRDDTIVSQLIKEMGNSDWVHQGLNFLNEKQDKCPFCQQSIDSDLKDKLEEIFDRTYEESLTRLRTISEKYNIYRKNVTDFIENVIDTLRASLGVEGIRDQYDKFYRIRTKISKKMDENFRIISDKIHNPSEIVNEYDIKYTKEDLNDIIR